MCHFEPENATVTKAGQLEEMVFRLGEGSRYTTNAYQEHLASRYLHIELFQGLTLRLEDNQLSPSD